MKSKTKEEYAKAFQDEFEYASDQLPPSTPDSVIDIVATQLVRANEAKERIESEGIVVRDMRGSVIPHPAIKIEIEAQKIIANLMLKNKKA